METYRLKNIILVILLLLNVFLLLLVASRGYAQHRSAQNLDVYKRQPRTRMRTNSCASSASPSTQ